MTTTTKPARLLVYETLHEAHNVSVRVECDGTQHFRITTSDESRDEFVCSPCAGPEVCEALVRKAYHDLNDMKNVLRAIVFEGGMLSLPKQASGHVPTAQDWKNSGERWVNMSLAALLTNDAEAHVPSSLQGRIDMEAR